MGEYTAKLAKRIKEQGSAGGSPGGSGNLLCAEYVSPSAIRIGGQLFSHNVRRNPECILEAGDTVLAAHVGSAFYIICKVV